MIIYIFKAILQYRFHFDKIMQSVKEQIYIYDGDTFP